MVFCGAWILDNLKCWYVICLCEIWNYVFFEIWKQWHVDCLNILSVEIVKCWTLEVVVIVFLKSRLCVVLLFFLVLNGGKLKCWIVFFVCNSVLFEMLIKQHWHFELLKTKKKLCGCLCVFEHLIYVCCFHMLKLWRFEIKHN